MTESRVTWLETFGLSPWKTASKDFFRALAGSPYVPPVKWGLSSVRIFKPSISFATWLRIRRANRLAPLYNFFSHKPNARDDGYSVRVTDCRDYRGGQFTYDSHMGTDFAIPVGTPVVAAASGTVVYIGKDLSQGGLRLTLDHGGTLFTVYNHLARTSVPEGAEVKRGEVICISGASGAEFVLFFPWVAPHLHFDVWLNGTCVDPFARPDVDEPSIWRDHNDPKPTGDREPEAIPAPTRWNAEGVTVVIEACRDPEIRAHLTGLPSVPRQGTEVLMLRIFRPYLFEGFPALFNEEGERRPVLDLPFRAEDYAGAAFPAGYRAGE